MAHTIACDYCGKPAKQVTGETIYPHRPDLAHKALWHCQPCQAYVGCHPGTNTPLGRLANAQLRSLKMQAHAAFDPFWRCNGPLSRSAAYRWLAQALDLPGKQTHIGMFDEQTCRRTITVCRQYQANQSTPPESISS